MLLFQVWFVMERKKKKTKLYIHIKRTPERVCCHGSFSPLLLSPSGMLRKRCSCCVVFSCFSTLTWSSHTHPYGVCEGNYPGENSFWNRGFFVDIRHTLSSHSNHDTIWNQFPFEILHYLFHLFTLCTYVFVTSYSRNENIYKRKCYTTIKNRIVQDRFLFEKI